MEDYLRPLIRKIIPEVFGRFEAIEVSTTGREEACRESEKMLAPEFAKYNIELKEVNLRHIQPPAKVLDAIAKKLAAIEDAKRMESESAGMIAKAKGEAEANRLRQVSLSPSLIQWEQIQAWKALAGSDNAKVIIPAGSNMQMLLQP